MTNWLRIAIMAALLTSVTARAMPLSDGGVTADEVARALTAQGLSVRAGNDNFGDPMIAGTIGNTKFFVQFYDCNKSPRCANIQFRAGYNLTYAMSPTRINDWNSKWRFGRLYLDPNNDPILDMDVDVRQGASTELLATYAARWVAVVREFERYIGWVG